MTAEALEPFEAGRELGHEAGVKQPLTEDQERRVRTILRQAETETPPAKAS